MSFPYCDGEGVAEVTHVIGSPGRVRTTELQGPVFPWTAVVMGPFAISLVIWVHAGGPVNACSPREAKHCFSRFRGGTTSKTSENY